MLRADRLLLWKVSSLPRAFFPHCGFKKQNSSMVSTIPHYSVWELRSWSLDTSSLLKPSAKSKPKIRSSQPGNLQSQTTHSVLDIKGLCRDVYNATLVSVLI